MQPSRAKTLYSYIGYEYERQSVYNMYNFKCICGTDKSTS